MKAKREKRMYSSTLSLTLARDGLWMLNATPRALYPREWTVPIVQEAWWASGPVWAGRESLSSSPGFEPRTVQPVVSRYTDHGRYKGLYILCTLHCDIIMWSKPTKYTLIKLTVEFNSWCLLHVLSVTCSSSGRQFVHARFYGMFDMHFCKQSSRWKDVLDMHEKYTMHVHMFFLMKNTRCSKHVEDTKHWIKQLI
jgi:hypothetical protein